MKRYLTKHVILIAILVLAAVLRIWNLGDVPPSASMDEASIGYNAYSVTKIGVDEFGDFPLISQRGYDDWRRSTYLFLVIPFVRILGLTAVAIRLPAVLLSVLSVWAVYHIVLLLFVKSSKPAVMTSLLAALLLAVSPWHVYISRLGHESNAYLSFFIFGILFFLQGIKQKSKMLFSMMCFILALISYYAGQVIVPLLGMGLIVIYRNTIFSILSKDSKMRLAAVICILVLIPVLWTIFSPSAMVRFSGTSAFRPEANQREFDRSVQLRNQAVANHDVIGEIRHNRRLFGLGVFLSGYVSHFSPVWLFTNSGSEPFKVPHLGLLYIWELPFLLVGLAAFFWSRKIDPRGKKLVFLWIILSPFPAAVATQAPHAMRSYTLAPVLVLFSAFGLAYIFTQWNKFKVLTYGALGFFIVWSLWTYYGNYFKIFPREQSRSFHYAMSQAVPYVLNHQAQYDKVVFSNENNLYQSYMLFLYYSTYDPQLYQREGGTMSGGYAETHAFGKFEFRPIKKDEAFKPNVLYVGNTADFALSVRPIAGFANLDGTIAIKAVTP